MPAFNAAAVAHSLQSLAIAKLILWEKALHDLFLQPGSTFSLMSLAAALIIATTYVVGRRVARGRRVRIKLVLRALFPRWLTHSASSKADLGFFLLNVFAVGGLIGWALISYVAVSRWTQGALSSALGRGGVLQVSHLTAEIGLTVILFLAYELAYWVDHYLSHEVPFLWEFHRVHHTAETLTPVTLFRVHPIDTLVFSNITALVMGVVNGVAVWLLGWPASEATLFGNNVILLTFVFITVHLQHSHVWIAFTGVWGRIFASPAHHQIHHSADPAHFGKNLGSCLALWDWVFGTLRIPTIAREPLVYGVEPGEESPHTITGGLITPFVRAFSALASTTARLLRFGARAPHDLSAPSIGSGRPAA